MLKHFDFLGLCNNEDVIERDRSDADWLSQILTFLTKRSSNLTLLQHVEVTFHGSPKSTGCFFSVIPPFSPAKFIVLRWLPAKNFLIFCLFMNVFTFLFAIFNFFSGSKFCYFLMEIWVWNKEKKPTW